MEEIIQMVEETPNDMELGKKLRKWYWSMKEKQEEYTKSLEGKWVYESPDGGKTVTRRPVGSPLSQRTIIKEELIEDWYKRDEV